MAALEDTTAQLERELDGLFASVSVSLAPSVVEALADDQIDREALLALRPGDLLELGLDAESEGRVLEARRLLGAERSLDEALLGVVAESEASHRELGERDERIRAHVERCVRRERAFGPGARVELFGSALSGLRVGWSADVDLCLTSEGHARDVAAARRAAAAAAGLEAASGAVEIARRRREADHALRAAVKARAQASARAEEAEAEGRAKDAAKAREREAHHEARLAALEADAARAEAAVTPAVRAAVEARAAAEKLGDKAKKVVYPLASALRRGGELTAFEVVRHARVPLVKAAMPSEGGAAVDVVPGNALACANSRLIRAYCAVPDAKRLCLLVKRWAKARGVVGAPDGHLSSYAHTLTVLHFCLVAGVVQGDLHAAADAAGLPRVDVDGVDATFLDLAGGDLAGDAAACGGGAAKPSSLAALLKRFFAYMTRATTDAAMARFALSCRARAAGGARPEDRYRFDKDRWTFKNQTAADQCLARLSVEDPFLRHDAARSHDVASTLDGKPYAKLKDEYARAVAILEGRDAAHATDAAKVDALFKGPAPPPPPTRRAGPGPAAARPRPRQKPPQAKLATNVRSRPAAAEKKPAAARAPPPPKKSYVPLKQPPKAHDANVPKDASPPQRKLQIDLNPLLDDGGPRGAKPKRQRRRGAEGR